MPSSWQILKKLGEGGVGKVSLAVTPKGEQVAVKVLSDRSRGPLLEHEAGLLVRLRHPAIASFLGYAKSSSEIFGEDRGPCLWVEYVEGEDFLSAAGRVRRDPVKIREWLLQALEALAYLHGQDVLHGDLSPENVRIHADGGLKLIDFGTATFGRGTASVNAATLLYLAPERVGGRNGPASDLFSLGTLFYEALAGVHPRAGCPSLREMIRRPVKPLRDARPDLAAEYAVLARVVDRMIVIDPALRFSAAGEVLEALLGGMGDAVAAAPVSRRETPDFYPVVMEGASEHLAEVENAVARLGERSRLFSLHGVTGVGKERFLRETAFQCALAGRPVREVYPGRFRESLEGLPSASGAVFFRSLQEVPAAQLASLLRVRKKDLPASALIVVWEWNEDALTEEARRILESFSSHPDVTDIRLENPGLEATRKPEVLRERVSMLSTDERRVLELLAAAHTPVGLDELLRAMGGEDVATIVLLDRLANRGFIEVDPETGRHRLAVPGLEGVLLSGMDEVVRNDRHRAWRDVLAAGRDDHPQKLHHALALGDAAFVARVAPNIVESLRTSRGFEEALRMTDAALELVQGLADTVATSRLLRIKGNLLNDLGRYREALGVAEEVYALAAPDEPMAVKTVKHWLVTGLIHQNLGDRAEAERRFERCLKEAMRFADDVPRSYAMRAHVLLGVEALRRGDPATARGHFEEGLSFAESRGWRRAEILRNLAVVHHREGDAEGAVRLLGEARGHYREEGNPEGEYAAWLEEGNLALERDDFAAAESAYARAEEIAKARDDDLLFASVWNNQGVLGRRRGDLGRSLERLQRALEVFRPLGNWIDLAECLKQNAITEAEVGRFDAAASKIAEIRAMIPKLASAGEKAAEAEKTLCALRDGIGEAAEDVAVARKRLTALYARLPKSLQISFEDRHDYKKWGHP